MRILEANKYFYPKRGAERHFLDLVTLLRSRGHEVAVFSMDDGRNGPAGVHDRFIPRVGYGRDDSTLREKLAGIGRLFWSPAARRAMRSMLGSFRPDVVHIHNAYHQLSLSFLPIVRARGIPIVQTVHDYHLVSPDKDEYYPSVGRSYRKFLLVRKYGIGKRILLVLKSSWERLWGFRDMVDRFVAPSEFVKRTLVQGGIPGEKIVVIPHFVVDPKAPSPPVSAGAYALYFGGVSGEKGIRELTDLFTRLRYPLVIAGKSTMEVGEGEFVKYVGENSREELACLIAGASFVVSASRLPETFGLIVLEANVLGKPFFGYRTGAFPELVENGRNGWLADTPEEFAALVGRAARGEVMAASPREIREATLGSFGAEAYASRIEELFSSLTLDKNTAPR